MSAFWLVFLILKTTKSIICSAVTRHFELSAHHLSELTQHLQHICPSKTPKSLICPPLTRHFSSYLPTTYPTLYKINLVLPLAVVQNPAHPYKMLAFPSPDAPVALGCRLPAMFALIQKSAFVKESWNVQRVSGRQTRT